MSLPGARIVVKAGEKRRRRYDEGGRGTGIFCMAKSWDTAAWLGAAAYAPDLPLCV